MSIVLETRKFVKQRLYGEGSGHDWWHIERVYNNSVQLMNDTHENINVQVVELSALLHDIADWKFTGGDETVGPQVAKEWLESQQVDEDIVYHVCQIVKDISFKGAGVQTPMKSLEGQIVQDADRLDAIGAIGIARVFAYGGHKGQEIFNPLIEPRLHDTAEQYKSQQTTSLNHFFEKLLLLKDRMNTSAGKRMAEERHQYMIEFLVRFLEEGALEETIHYQLLKKYKDELKRKISF